MSLKNETRCAGGATGLDKSSFLAGLDNRDIPPKRLPPQAQNGLRLKFLASRLHGLGAKPLFHFLDEVERGKSLRAHLEVYARLPVAFIKANRGDQFAPAVHIVDGDGR